MRSSLKAARILAGGAAATLFASSVACAPAHSAIALLAPGPGGPDSGVRGSVRLEQVKGQRKVKLIVKLSGLTPGAHGFHIHTLGNLSKGCMSAGGHFNPLGAEHGGPSDAPNRRHAGDLGNVVADEKGDVDAVLEDECLSLEPGHTLNVVGRSVVVHADQDDLGRGSAADSRTTGHAGARVACGVIGLDADLEVA